MGTVIPFGYETLGQLLDIARNAQWADWAEWQAKIEAYREGRERENPSHVEWMAVAWSEYFRGNDALSRSAIEKCVMQTPLDSLVIANAATLLANSGAAREAAEMARRLVRMTLAGSAREVASKVFVQTFHLEEALTACVPRPETRNAEAEIEHMLEVFEGRGLTLERRLHVHDIVVDTLKKRGAHIVGCHPFLAPGFGFAHYTLHVKSDGPCTLDSHNAVVRALIGQFEDIYDDVFMVSPSEVSIPGAERVCGEGLCL